MSADTASNSELPNGRRGKIARLPEPLRVELNRRLADGDPGEEILAWLHGLPEVHEMLARHFGGEAISKQNLSRWRRGGFQDWRREEDVRRWIGTLGEADSAAREAVDRRAVGSMVAARLLYELSARHEAASAACRTPDEALATTERTIRSLGRVRRQDHREKALELREMSLRLRADCAAWRREHPRRSGGGRRGGKSTGGRCDGEANAWPVIARAVAAVSTAHPAHRADPCLGPKPAQGMMEQTLGMLRGALAQAVARDEAKAGARSGVGVVGGAGVATVATVTSGSPAPTREASPRGPEAATEPRPEGSPATVRGVAKPVASPAPVTVSHAWSRYNALKRDELVAAEDTEGPGVTIVAKPAQFAALRYRSTRYDACVTRVSEIQNPVSLVSVVTGMSDSLRRMLRRANPSPSRD